MWADCICLNLFSVLTLALVFFQFLNRLILRGEFW